MEDEADIRNTIRLALGRAGYRVAEAGNGAIALRMIETEQPALVVMDVNMPEMGGFAALETLRRLGCAIPVLMLSAQAEIERRVKGLGLGADDYMAKPFDLRELIARVGALLRRGSDFKPATTLLRHGDLTIDLTAKHAERAGQTLPLTAMEFSILEVLARAAGRPVSREHLLESVWGYSQAADSRTVETHIWRLRKKLGDSADDSAWIRNRPGLGYLLDQGKAAPPPTRDVAAA